MKRTFAAVRGFFDVRSGEHLRLWSMFFYLLFVLFAYYIVKPVSRAMFLTKFDIDKLPVLYILIALFGGVLAYFYSKVATKVSLSAAVSWAMGLSILILVVMWWLIRMRIPWMVYALNIWVSLFSVILVSQGWLVASNLFNAREAKRLYPILDMGMVVGAAFGGEFTKRAVALIGTESLLLASAGMVALAYGASLIAVGKSRSAIEHAHAASNEETDFSFSQMLGDISRVRHLRIIVGMMIVMYLVDTLVEYQFQAMARTSYKGDQLTAFFGQFYGLWLNGIEFVFQLFLTGVVVRWFGIGATLQISPVAVGLSSVAILAAPGVLSTSAVRLTEASTRYTMTKTGMELLYMPLPLALRNRIKAFIDICVDRLSRGIGGVLLLFLTAGTFHLGMRGLAIIVAALCGVWIFYSAIARKEYVAEIRRRLESRRLDLASIRLSVTDASTVAMLEAAARGSNPRQASYALSLLAEAPDYKIQPMLTALATSESQEVRERVFRIAADSGFEGIVDAAEQQLRRGTATAQAIRYLLTVSRDRQRLAADLLEKCDPSLLESALENMRPDAALAEGLISAEWIESTAVSPDPKRRALAAAAISVRQGKGTEALQRLLDDPDDSVTRSALRAAGSLRNRKYFFLVVAALERTRLRGDAIQALVAFGPAVIGSLSDLLNDDQVSIRIRRLIPRVLKKIPDQRSVEVLMPAMGHADLAIRAAVLKALNYLRETAPQLAFEVKSIDDHLLREARTYYELSAALAPFRGIKTDGYRATNLLARTLEDRLNAVLARLFRLLGLRYPPKDVYSAYLAVSKPTRYDATAALEFLDNLLDRGLKRVLVPILDSPQNILDHGQELFGVAKLSAEQAIRAQIRSGDPWLAACAMAAAVEMKVRGVAPDVVWAAEQGTGEVSRVARSVQVALA
jgi:AAA family ATP:ADP antiporter